MVCDINSPGESTRIISKLMQWTDEKQIHLHTILHQNKGDENARGHIGTELNNKAESVLLVEECDGFYLCGVPIGNKVKQYTERSIFISIVMENGMLFCRSMDIVYDNYRLRLS